MPAKDKEFQTAVDQAAQTAKDAGAAIASRADDVKQTLTAAGRDIADKAATVGGQAGEAALAARDKTIEAAGVVTERAGELAHNVADQLPRDAQEWEALGRDLRDRIRANPTPWVIGAGAVLVAWLIGRRSAR
ncbi:hypothetical protein [Catellatospora sp. NPDC049609]|uniref:hypothetical protein n=1 Tax=Catellatospora sp. NPDC049609 TaxID=3155505 RepID=UPI0034123423